MTRLRLRQARLLAAPLWRARAWSLVVLSALLVLVAVVALRLAGHPPNPAFAGVAAALLLAGGAAYALDDPSAPLVAALPAPLGFRTGVRVGGTLLLVGLCWAAVLGYVATTDAALLQPTLLFAVLVAVGLAAGQWYGGVTGGPAVIGFVVAASRLPRRWNVIEDGTGARARLVVLLVVACAVLAAGARDPAARRSAQRA